VKSTPRGSLLTIIHKKTLRVKSKFFDYSGLPPHKLVLKVNCTFYAIRNLNTKEALVYGTRMRIKFMHRNAIACEVLIGSRSAIREFLISHGHKFTHIQVLFYAVLICQRSQFSIITAFAMIINKSQKQTFEKIAILAPVRRRMRRIVQLVRLCTPN
jgi:hypothetical protein